MYIYHVLFWLMLMYVEFLKLPYASVVRARVVYMVRLFARFGDLEIFFMILLLKVTIAIWLGTSGRG